MSVAESVADELVRLGVTDWRREIAARLAEKVDDEGTASAASLLRTLMVDAASERPSATTAVDQIRASLLVTPGANRRNSMVREPKPETMPKTPAGHLSGAICVECGEPIPAATAGRPRVRHRDCRRTRR